MKYIYGIFLLISSQSFAAQWCVYMWFCLRFCSHIDTCIYYKTECKQIYPQWFSLN